LTAIPIDLIKFVGFTYSSGHNGNNIPTTSTTIIIKSLQLGWLSYQQD
jgi:hypothetical protein